MESEVLEMTNELRELGNVKIESELIVQVELSDLEIGLPDMTDPCGCCSAGICDDCDQQLR
jgi:hypothetical protein